MNNNYIQVLWVEDDPQITVTYPIEAAQYGIELVPFSCWKEAEEALRTDFKRWSAIVLDAKCKYKHDSPDNAKIFLSQAIYAITKICAEKHWIIPWFVLSGGSEDELNDLIIDSREEWDSDWKQKKYYSKTTDRDILFHRIPYKARMSPEMQIRLVYYPDVFKAIRNAHLGDNVEIYMEDLLLPIHSNNYDTKDYNNKMTLVRKCIEQIFQSMVKHGILPDIVRKKRGINTTWCCKILSGKDLCIDKDNNVIVKSYECILPNVMKDSFLRLKEITDSNEHSSEFDVSAEQQKNSRQTSLFLEKIGNAPYLLRGMVMELCTIILWYDTFLSDHDDEELNALNWEVQKSQ